MKKWAAGILVAIIVAVLGGNFLYIRMITPVGLSYSQYKQGMKIYNLCKEYENGKIEQTEFVNKYNILRNNYKTERNNEKCWNQDELFRALSIYYLALTNPDNVYPVIIKNGKTIDQRQKDLENSKETIEVLLDIN